MITARPKPLRFCVDMEFFVKSFAFGRHFGVFVMVMMMMTSVSNAGGQAVQDSRCYLMNGGAVESFFVSEDIPIGSIIGTLNVHGDPDEISGNIILSLTEKDSPVTISPGSKNLTLIKGLDKEAVTGPSSVYVNVRCDRKGTTDPSFVIPVSVRVTDANDNAPVWASAPYAVRLSELTAVGTRVLAARATDADQHGPHATVHYGVVPGPHSDYFEFVNELEGTLMLKKPLDYEALSNLSVSLRAQDQGHPPLYSDTELHVEVLDADDQNPKFLDEHYTAQLQDKIVNGMELSVSPRAISAVDQDVGINAPLFYSITGDYKENFLVEKDSGRLFVANVSDDMDMPVTLVIRATQYDNADRYALATLTVSRSRSRGRDASRSTMPVHFSQPAYSTAVLESLPPGSVVLTLHTDPPQTRTHRDKVLQYYVSDRSFLNNFMINSVGEVVLRKALDYELQQQYHYQVMVTDGTHNDTTAINITVQNVNDWEPRFRYPQYEFFVSPQPTDESGRMFVGQLEVADGDRGDYVSLSLRGPDSYLFEVDDTGVVSIHDASVALLNSSLVQLVGVAVDSGMPPRQTSVPIIVHMSDSLMSTTGVAASGGILIIIVFGSIMSVLAVVILALIAYIYSVKRPKSSGRSNKVATGYIQHEKSLSSEQSAGSGAGGGGLAAAGASSGSLLSISAGASTILANSNSSLNLNGTLNGQEGATRTSQRVLPPRHKTPAPAPPVPPPTHMSDHIHEGGAGGAGGRSGVAWPSATIPARVKKLSWDDDDHKSQNGPGSGSVPAPTAEIHDATNPNVAEHMNLTVYF